jgi:hypothetical protein
MANIYPQSDHPKAGLERAVWLVCIVLTAVFLTCLQFTTTKPFPLASFARLIHFHAVEPFQHRILIPAIAAGLQHFLAAGNTLLFAALELCAWISLLLLSYRALVVFNVGRSDFIRRVLSFVIIVPMLTEVVVRELHVMPAFAIGAHGLGLGHWDFWPLFYYCYDLPAAAFTLALVLMLARYSERPSRGLLAAYLVLFAVATANRETTVFLISFSALLFWRRLPAKQWLGLLLLQLAIFAAIELPLYWLFRDHINPHASLAGSRYETHLFENLGFLSHPLYLIDFLVRFMAGLYLPVLLWWRFLDWRLARALVGFALPLVVFAMIGGRLPEHRIFIEAVPLVWVAAMQVIARRCAQAQDARAHAPETTTAPVPNVVAIHATADTPRQDQTPAAREAAPDFADKRQKKGSS